MALANMAWRMLRIGLRTRLDRFRRDEPLQDTILRFLQGFEGHILALLRVRSREASASERRQVEGALGSIPSAHALRQIR